MSVPGQREEALGFAPCITSPRVASPQHTWQMTANFAYPRPLHPWCCEGGGGRCGSPGRGEGLPCALLLSGLLLVQFLQRAEGFELLKPAQSNPELVPAQLGCVHKWAVASSPLQESSPLGWERLISSGIL